MPWRSSPSILNSESPDPGAYSLLRRIAELWETLHPTETGSGSWQIDSDDPSKNLTGFERSAVGLFPALADLELPTDLGSFASTVEESMFDLKHITFTSSDF